MRFINLCNYLVISCFVYFWTFCSMAVAVGCISTFDIKNDLQLNEKLYLMLGYKNVVDQKSNDRQAVNTHLHIKNYVNMKGLVLLADSDFSGLNGSMQKAYEEAAKVYTPEELHQLGWKYFIGNTAEFRYLSQLFLKKKNKPAIVKDMYDVIQVKYKYLHRYKIYSHQKLIDEYFDGDPVKAFINMFAILDVKSFIRARWVPVFSHKIHFRERSSRITYQLNQELILVWLKNRISEYTFYDTGQTSIFNKGVKWSYYHISNMLFGGDMLRAFVLVVSAFQLHNRTLKTNNKSLDSKFFIWKYPFIGDTFALQRLAYRIQNPTDADNIWKYQGDEGLSRYADKWFNGDKYKTYVNVYHAMSDRLESFYMLQWPEPPKLPINVLILLYDDLFIKQLPPISQSQYVYDTVIDHSAIKTERSYQHYFPKIEYDVNAVSTNFTAYSNEVIDYFHQLSKSSRPFYLRLFSL